MADSWDAGTNTPKIDDLVEVVEALGPRLARVSAKVVTLPLYVLPQADRDDAIQTTTKLFEAVGVVHFGLTKAVFGTLGKATSLIGRFAGAQSAQLGSRTTRVPIETGPTLQ